jgi:hypothetical protein
MEYYVVGKRHRLLARLDPQGGTVWETDIGAWGTDIAAAAGQIIILVPSAKKIQVRDPDGSLAREIATPGKWAGMDAFEGPEGELFIVGGGTSVFLLAGDGSVIFEHADRRSAHSIMGSLVRFCADEEPLIAYWASATLFVTTLAGELRYEEKLGGGYAMLVSDDWEHKNRQVLLVSDSRGRVVAYRAACNVDAGTQSAEGSEKSRQPSHAPAPR